MNEQRLNRITNLTVKLLEEGTITPDEQAELDRWLHEHAINQVRFKSRIDMEEVLQSLIFEAEGAESYERVRERLKDFLQQIPPEAKQKRYWISWYKVNAAAILLVVTGLWIVIGSRYTSPAPVSINRENVRPERVKRPILELSDGSRVDLASAAKGAVLARDGNAEVLKRDSGQLSYQHINGHAASVGYNTLITPRGGTYRVDLPDGTIVWLNAESSLHFPTSFTGAQREVEMTGEGYFEVAKNEAQPFIVKAGQMKIKVLGTHFNVQVYPGEKEEQATLLEGAIALEAVGKSVLVRPGEQVQVASQVTIGKVDTSEVMAWKEGFLEFTDADMETVGRRIRRWFNVKVIFRQEKTDWRMYGRIRKETTIRDLLEILQANGLAISIDSAGTIIKGRKGMRHHQ